MFTGLSERYLHLEACASEKRFESGSTELSSFVRGPRFSTFDTMPSSNCALDRGQDRVLAQVVDEQHFIGAACKGLFGLFLVGPGLFDIHFGGRLRQVRKHRDLVRIDLGKSARDGQLLYTAFI